MTKHPNEEARRRGYPRPGRARLDYDDELGGHVCTTHGATVQVDREIEPTESGSWHYSCTVEGCTANGWSGL